MNPPTLPSLARPDLRLDWRALGPPSLADLRALGERRLAAVGGGLVLALLVAFYLVLVSAVEHGAIKRQEARSNAARGALCSATSRTEAERELCLLTTAGVRAGQPAYSNF